MANNDDIRSAIRVLLENPEVTAPLGRIGVFVVDHRTGDRTYNRIHGEMGLPDGERSAVDTSGLNIAFTVSAGATSGIPGSRATIDTFCEAADGALYEAKGGGRNCIRYASTPDGD